jgi:hypothetical protein
MMLLSATKCSCIATFVSQSSEFCLHNPLCCFLSVYCCCYLFHYRLSLETFGYTIIFSCILSYFLQDFILLFLIWIPKWVPDNFISLYACVDISVMIFIRWWYEI